MCIWIQRVIVLGNPESSTCRAHCKNVSRLGVQTQNEARICTQCNSCGFNNVYSSQAAQTLSVSETSRVFFVFLCYEQNFIPDSLFGEVPFLLLESSSNSGRFEKK